MTDVDCTLEKLNNLKPLISCNEELYITKEEKKENALASEGKSCRPEKINIHVMTSEFEIYFNNERPKFTFAQSKCFPPKYNLPDKENNSLEQAVFWNEVKVVCCVPIPHFYTSEIK